MDKLPPGTFYAFPEEMVGMLYAISSGLELQVSCPWVEEMFREGSSIATIAKDDRIAIYVRGQKRTIETAVTYALKGYDGSVEVSSIRKYNGLLSRIDYDQLVKEHNSASTLKLNAEMQREGIGLAGISVEERRKIGRRSGLKQYEEGIGIHGHTYEQHREVLKLATIARGNIPWTDDEMELCYNLSRDATYRKGTSRTNWKNITEILNQQYDNNRNSRSVAKAVLRWEKHLKNLDKLSE